MKLNIKTIGVVLLVVVLFFIFFSKTIYTYNLPNVTAVLPSNGKLNKSEKTTGIVDWADIEEIYAEMGGKVDEILVSEGEKVSEGQPLMRFSFDSDEVERALRELEISRKKLSVDIESIQIRLNKTKNSISALESETYEAESVSGYELSQISGKMSRLEEDYEVSRSLKMEEYEEAKMLFEVGAVTRQEIEALERDLEKLDYDYLYNMRDYTAQYENLLETMEEKEKKESDNVADKEKSKAKTLLDYQYDVQSLQQDLKTKNLELSNMELQEEKYRKTLADYDRYGVISAPDDSTVISIPVKKGQHINANAQLISLGVGSAFKIECNISLENNFVSAGDTCTIGNSSRTMDAEVTKLTPGEGGKLVTVAIESDEVSAGETFDILFEKESADRYTLVPNGAINKDSDGYYLYQIKRRDGILGKEYYAEKLRVYIGDSDSDNTVITKGVTFFEPVVMLSDKSFSENDTLVLENEGDFFASE